jgi:carbon-monoxide dehydrogenase large subunit
MEPRAVLAAFDASTEELTLWVSCQAPFRIRAEVARLLGLAESRVRVIAPDVGGGFGVKSGPYREEILLAWLAVTLGRPVKWIATRGEDQITPTTRVGPPAMPSWASTPRGASPGSAPASPRRSAPR